MARFRFQCCECGCSEYADIEGFGEDEYGEFTDYVCTECGAITRVSYKE
ncbi:hypothetical protein [Clostridium sporogenes]|nr:hypothetical protein [Clostridium sporogenes]KRU40040.1 hypothetical protein VT94_25170 [Clostridium sporogenes]MBY7065145.1 hypothetical protein [Clostridium sporogenes]MBY7071809.1 hypothetical protein [Clostridium sporogenes]MCW6065867.1 hypothetical protein [Clostridium sporogenes]OQP88562.1 hypothetical protein VT93_0202060 [Clostridium sporogenes]